MAGFTGEGHEELLDGIREFACEFVGNEVYHKKFPSNPKIVHDPLWGTIKLHPWEVALLDLPLFQRLRQIHQTSLVYYVFPGCSHTRFEHTLGVIQQTQRLIDAVNSNQYPSNQHRYEPTTIRTLRLAALFHDCGHACFSHISEEIYGSCPDMAALMSDPSFPKCHPHEAFSSLILMSAPVRGYIAELEKHYRIELDVDKAAKWITGTTADEAQRKHFETQVINGPFDADKLDYIFRDAHYSGIPVGLDLDRLWASCDVNDAVDGRVLTLHQASVAPLEQILFSKISLFSVVYQHPKVRAAEKMFQAVIEGIQKSSTSSFQVAGRNLGLKRSTDFLWLTDEGFFSEALRRPQNDPLHCKVHDIRYRRFLVRALTISNDTIDENCNEGFMQLRKLNQHGVATYTAKRQLAEAIVTAANLDGKVDPLQVWVDLPSDPSFGEADRTFVRTASKGLRKVSDLFPIHYWSELYQKYKWRGHVFCPVEFQQQIHEGALKVFKEVYDVGFKKSGGDTSHVPDPKSSC